MAASPEWAIADTSFSYQGELKDNGALANGAYDLEFALWNAVVGGGQIGSTVSRAGVSVAEGRFTVELDFGASAFDNSDRWLEIDVNGITLTPRTSLTRAPYSIQTRGIFVNDAGNIGIGTTNPQRQLDLEAPEAMLRLTATDTTPGKTSRLQFRGSNGPSIFHPMGAIEFFNEADQLRATMSANKSGASAAQLNLSVTPGEVGQLRVTSNSVRVGDELEVVRRTDLSTGAAIGTNGFDSFFQMHGGNVGIGTDAPTSPLHILSNQPYTRYDDTDGGNQWLVGVQGSNVGFNIQEAGVGTRFVINEGGNVGIGTIFPEAKLDIEGTAGVDGIRFPDETLQVTAAPRIISAEIFVDPPMVLAGGSISQSFVIPGVEFGDAIVATPGGVIAPSVGIGNVRVWATNEIIINYINSGSVDRDPTGTWWQFRVIK